MSKNKLFYESPLAEAFVVRIERPLMSAEVNSPTGFKDKKASVQDYSDDEYWW